MAVDRALMPTKRGFHILIVGGDIRRAAKLRKVGDLANVELRLNTEPEKLDLPEELVLPLFAESRRIAAAMSPALGAQGTFVAINNVVSQSVPHLHVHVVPRSKGDGLRGFFWPRTTYAEGEPAAYGRLLREALDG